MVYSFKVTTDTWAFFFPKIDFLIFCYLLFDFIDNDIKHFFKKNHRLVFELWLSKDMHNKPFFSKNVQG